MSFLINLVNVAGLLCYTGFPKACAQFCNTPLLGLRDWNSGS